ncbi:MAG: sulfotransferase [Firmicutes bacterium]|nr:sulfotransferase [Bacillota bacterium]
MGSGPAGIDTFTPASPTRRRAVVVLGMHRSGTSATTAMLAFLGVEIGEPSEHLPPPGEGSAETNRKGFFELQPIVEYQERILAALGRRWDTIAPLPDPDQWTLHPEVRAIKTELKSYLRQRFGTTSRWGFKDPRTCRLLPLWLDVLRELGCEPSFLIVVRNPKSVAHSLAARDGFSLLKGEQLWLLHMSEVITQTRGYRRVVTSYEELLQDPRRQLLRVAERLELPLADDAEIERYCTQFLEPEMNHHPSQGSAELGAELDPEVQRLYRYLMALAKDEVDFDPEYESKLAKDVLADARYRLIGELEAEVYRQDAAIREVREQADQALAAAKRKVAEERALRTQAEEALAIARREQQRLLDELEQMRERLATLEGALSSQLRQQQLLADRLHILESSVSWRLTAPLRVVRWYQLRWWPRRRNP